MAIATAQQKTKGQQADGNGLLALVFNWRGSLIGKAEDLKSFAVTRLQVRALSPPLTYGPVEARTSTRGLNPHGKATRVMANLVYGFSCADFNQKGVRHERKRTESIDDCS